MTQRARTGVFIGLVNHILTRALAVILLVALPMLAAVANTVVVYGASGRVGGAIVTETLNRGHEVIGVSRDPASLNFEHANFIAVRGDVTNLDSMLKIIAGSDVVIIAVRGNGADNSPESSATNQAALTFIEATHRLGDAAPRVIQVGGGTTLWKDGIFGLENDDTEEGTARHGMIWGHWVAIENYRASTDVAWTVMTPPPGLLLETERTGLYRIGEDDVLVDDQGESAISRANFAAAIIDEIEKPQSIGKRITVGPW